MPQILGPLVHLVAMRQAREISRVAAVEVLTKLARMDEYCHVCLVQTKPNILTVKFTRFSFNYCAMIEASLSLGRHRTVRTKSLAQALAYGSAYHLVLTGPVCLHARRLFLRIRILSHV